MSYINKIKDGTNSLDNYSDYIAVEYQRHYEKQKAENYRLSEQLVRIGKHRTNLKQKLVELEQRVEEMEEIIGGGAQEMG